jgi:hypothetical protein
MTYEETIASQMEARRKFGRLMYCWRVYNTWTQYTACKWAKEVGFEIISYGNLSVLERGMSGELRQKAFFQLEELNRRLHDRDYGNIKSIDLRRLVEDSIPLLHQTTEKPWNAIDFWSCYIGRLSMPTNLPVWEASEPNSTRKYF